MAFLKKNKYANIEIQDYVIRYAEVKKKKSMIATQCDEHYFPTGVIENGQIINEQVFLRTLKHCIRKWKLKGKKVRFIVPDSSVIIRTVDVPPEIEDDELTGHVYFELGQSIHLPFENPVIDAVSLGIKDEMKQALVVASSEEVVDSYYEYLKDERTYPTAADVSALCQYRLYHEKGLTNDQDTFLLAQFNVKSVTISIFEKHRPVFMQQVNIPYPENAWRVIPLHQGGHLTREQFDRKKVESAFEEIYTEMERIVRFYQYSLHNGDKEINRLLLTGDHPYLTDLMDGVKERLDIPVNILPPEEIKTTKNTRIGCHFYNVIGLALKEGV